MVTNRVGYSMVKNQYSKITSRYFKVKNRDFKIKSSSSQVHKSDNSKVQNRDSKVKNRDSKSDIPRFRDSKVGKLIFQGQKSRLQDQKSIFHVTMEYWFLTLESLSLDFWPWNIDFPTLESVYRQTWNIRLGVSIFDLGILTKGNRYSKVKYSKVKYSKVKYQHSKGASRIFQDHKSIFQGHKSSLQGQKSIFQGQKSSLQARSSRLQGQKSRLQGKKLTL